MSKPNGLIQEALLDMIRAQAAMLRVNAEVQASQQDIQRRLTAVEQRLDQTIAFMTQRFDELEELVRGKLGFGKR